MKSASRDLNTFEEGQTVNVSDIEEFQLVQILRISDSGVYVKGPKCLNGTVLSGRSPARLAEQADIEEFKQAELEKNGSNLKWPEKPFTIREFSELNSLDLTESLKWVKLIATLVGKAEKIEGQRGKTPNLYKYEKPNVETAGSTGL